MVHGLRMDGSYQHGNPHVIKEICGQNYPFCNIYVIHKKTDVLA